jgi:predicted DCC family thiol-disulfide oxidoreductase YuxK
MSRPKRVVLFDGVCNLCNWSVRHIVRNDPHGRFQLASLQSPVGRRLVSDCGLDPDALDTVVLIENGRVYTRSDAALRIGRRLQGLSRFLWPTRLVPRPIRDAFYDWVSRNRYRIFGKREVCMVPDPGFRERFLDAEETTAQVEVASER